MLALARAAPKRVPGLCVGRVTVRSFAEVVGAPSGETSSTNPPPTLEGPNPTTPQGSASRQLTSKGKVPVREDHGLYGFFRKKDGTDLVGDARFEVVETPERMQHATGRGWKASELRLKSFEDLHTLWYILLRERNLLATQKEEARRMGVTDTGTQVSLDRVHQCRKSMARIKAVINERRLAYEGAVKLVDKQREQHQDNVVLQHQVTEQRKERKYLQRRRAYMERRNAERLMRRKAHEKTLLEKRLWATDTEVKTEGAKASEEKQIPVSVESFTGSEVQAEMPSEPPAKATSPTIKPADSKNEKDQKTAVKKAKLPKAFPKPAVDQTPSTPIDAAAAGLFGVAQVGKGSRRV